MKKENEQDIQLENENLDDSIVEEEHSRDKLKRLKEELKTAESKAKEYLDGWQRAQADFVNLRRRDEEARAEFIKFANASLVEELIPVLDSFNIALSQGHKDLEPLYGQLLSVLKTSGLEEINPSGEPFRPEEHEALSLVKAGKPEDDNKVLEVLQKGYKFTGRVIRPAKVRVGEFSE